MHLYFGVMASFNYFMFHPLTPKSDQHLISPYNIASESKKITRIKEMLLTKEPLDCYINSPYQHLKKCIEKSMENIHTDARVKRVKRSELKPLCSFS